jgi:hypothetical protein
MTIQRTTGWFVLIAVLNGAIFSTLILATQDELERDASWHMPDQQQISKTVDQWLETLEIAQPQKQSAQLALQSSIAQDREPLDTVMAVIAEAYPRCKSLIIQADLPANPLSPIEISQFETENLPAFATNHLRLFIGRWMVQNNFLDEALPHFEKLTTDDVLDPAALLFYKSIAQHGLLEKDECIENLEKLLENERLLPARFVSLGKLMLADIHALEKDSLSEISRLMNDIGRRQSLYRSGKVVRDIEDEVVKKLDRMIEELEKKRQQQQASASAQPSAPMQDSQIAGGKGAGKTDSKKIEPQGQWGNVSPEKRAAAMAEMTRDLPPHYRAIIEAYFRQLSQDKKLGEGNQ